MAADLILTASSIITMGDAHDRAEALAIDTSTGQITAVGTLAEVQAAAPGVAVTDLGTTVVMPGFIDAHSHPLLSGMLTQPPAYWMAPYMGYPTYADVQKLFTEVEAKLPAGQAALFAGLDRLLQGAPELTNAELDAFFPSRPVIVVDNSGHEVYFNSVVVTLNGWADNKPPADPVGARFGRNANGTSNGRAYETAAILIAVAVAVDAIDTGIDKALTRATKKAGMAIDRVTSLRPSRTSRRASTSRRTSLASSRSSTRARAIPSGVARAAVRRPLPPAASAGEGARAWCQSHGLPVPLPSHVKSPMMSSWSVARLVPGSGRREPASPRRGRRIHAHVAMHPVPRART